MKIGIVMGTVRENRKSYDVANYILETSKKREDKEIEYEIIDLKDFKLPVFAEALPPAASEERESKEGKAWSKKLDSIDAFIFITAEYNRSIPGALKNATDYVSREFRNKAGAIVSYGVTGGNSAADHLRLVLSRLGLLLVRNQPYFNIQTDFDNDKLSIDKKESTANSITSMVDATVTLATQLEK